MRYKRLFRFPWRRAEQIRQDVDAELSFHLEMRAKEMRDAGLPPVEAAAQARERFGDLEFTKEYCRDADTTGARRAHRLERLASLLHDLEPRVLRQHRGFSACVILSLGVGISSAAAVITVVDSMKHGPLPFANADRLEHLYSIPSSAPGERRYMLASEVVRALQAPGSPVEAMTTYRFGGVSIRDREHTLHANVARTATNFAATIGMRMSLGRPIDSTDAKGPPATVLTYALWKRSFGSDSSLVGRSLDIDGVSHMVVGIAAPDWVFPSGIGAWTSDLATGSRASADQRTLAVALVRPGADRAQARAAISALGTVAVPLVRGKATASRVLSESFRSHLTSGLRGQILVLTCIAVFVAFITAVNFASLVLARGIRRRGEIGVRAALGASVSRLARHIVGECVALCAIGGLLAALLAPPIVASLRSMMGEALPSWLHVSLSWRTVALSVATAVIVGIVFGLGPAVDLARPALTAFLRGASNTMSAGVGLARTRASLVAIQVALATGVLMLLGGLFGRTMLFNDRSPGFDRESMILGFAHFDTLSRQQSAARVSALLYDVQRVPGVAGAAFVERVNLDPSSILSPDLGGAAVDIKWITWNAGTPGFLKVMRPRLVAGRFLTDEEEASGAPVAVVTDVVAKGMFASRAVGQKILIEGRKGERPTTQLSVVGVIEDITRSAWQTEPSAEIFSPRTDRAESPPLRSGVVWIRAGGPTSRVVRDLQQQLPGSVAGSQLFELHSLEALNQTARHELRSVAQMVLSIFGVALGLAALGIYGLVTYTAEMRSRELAIRESLGATRLNVAGLVLRGAAMQAVVGAACGVVIAGLLVAYLRDFNVELSLMGGTTAVALLLVGLTVLISSIGPLRHAWTRDLSAMLRA